MPGVGEKGDLKVFHLGERWQQRWLETTRGRFTSAKWGRIQFYKMFWLKLKLQVLVLTHGSYTQSSRHTSSQQACVYNLSKQSPEMTTA